MTNQFSQGPDMPDTTTTADPSPNRGPVEEEYDDAAGYYVDGDRLRLTLAQTDANLCKLERDYKRTLDLSEKGLLPKSTAENTKFDLDALHAARGSRDRAGPCARARAPSRRAARG